MESNRVVDYDIVEALERKHVLDLDLVKLSKELSI
jgi:6-phosphofructokinase 1